MGSQMDECEGCGHMSSDLNQNGECPCCASLRRDREERWRRRPIYDEDPFWWVEHAEGQVRPIIYALVVAVVAGLALQYWYG